MNLSCILQPFFAILLSFLVLHDKPGLTQVYNELHPLHKILNPDGTLNIKAAADGSFNPEGYRMNFAENGEPIFVSSDLYAPAAIESVDDRWDDQFYVDGFDGDVSAIAVDSSGNIYVGGYFAAINGQLMNYIAKWDGNSWSPLGNGVNNAVKAIAISGSDVYVGGRFTMAGNVSANRIAKWDGSNWSALGSGLDDRVESIAIDGSDIYVGGVFNTAGIVSARQIAKWDGSSWSALGSGVNMCVYAIAVSGSDVYAGGWFNEAGGQAVTAVARWNGSNWSGLGNGLNYGLEGCHVYAIAISGSDVYVGGTFETAGGAPANAIARWDGNNWSALGSGAGFTDFTHGWVSAITIKDNDVYVAGWINTAGGNDISMIARWDGSNWWDVGGGVTGEIVEDGINRDYALAVHGNDIYFGGGFIQAGGISAIRIAKWDGENWSSVGQSVMGGKGAYQYVKSIAASGDELYVAGNYTIINGLVAGLIFF